MLWKGKTDDDGECIFKKLEVPYSIIMDVGPGPDIRQGRKYRKRQKSEIRLHTIVAADRIVVLNNGEIVQTGTHRELITQKGLYADMWRKQ